MTDVDVRPQELQRSRRPLDHPATRTVWRLLAAGWLALAAILSFRQPQPWCRWMPGWLPGLMVAVAALKAAMLVWFYPCREMALKVAKGAVVASAVAAVGLADATAATVEVPLLWVLLGGGQMVVALFVWRRW